MPSKNSGQGGEIAIVGPTIRLKDEIKDELELVLRAEVTNLESYDWGRIPEARGAAFTWLHLYHGLVFLAAALDEVGPEDIDPPEDGHKWKYGHRVPAFTIGGEGEIGWFYPELMGAEFSMAGLKGKYLEALGTTNVVTETDLVSNLAQTVELEGCTAPMLKHFLTKLKAYATMIESAHMAGPEQANHIKEHWLNLCYASIVELSNLDIDNDHTKAFLQRALSHLNQIWGEQPNAKVNFVKGWLPLADLDNGSFVAEFGRLFPLSEAQKIIATGTEQAQRELNILITILKEVNRTTYWFIYRRLTGEPDNEGVSHCLENAVARITALISDDAQKIAWNYLLFAACGSIAWGIGQQLSRVPDLLNTSTEET